MSHFKATEKNPFHISVGGLVFNDEGKILVHHFKNKTFGDLSFENVYILLRETIEPDESIESALHRGLMEEFGLRGEFVQYLGSIKGKYPIGSTHAEKTTLYCAVKYIEHDEKLRQVGSPESESELRWVAPDVLVDLMSKQLVLDPCMDESPIVKRFSELNLGQ